MKQPAGPELQEPAAFEAGVFLVNKPVGPTSFRIVHLVRRALQIKKVGHAGTLDPFASGLLLVCAGRPATRIISRLMVGEKEYQAVLKFGVETDTQDLEGTIIAERPVGDLSPESVDQCLQGFLGEQLQAPPYFSALKHQGKPLYEYARQGINIDKEPRLIHISAIKRLHLSADTLTIRVTCSKGVYIRTLAADIGARLGPGAHLIALERTRIGPFSVTAALDGALLQESGPARNLLLQQLLTVDETLRLLEGG